MHNNFGILSYGAYIPRGRLQRRVIYETNAWFAPSLAGLAKGERAAANWDEDPITMGVEAARDALTGFSRDIVTSLALASTTHPFSDRSNAGVIKEALNIADTVGVMDSGGSQRAATAVLNQMLNNTHDGAQLCIASELRHAKPASEVELTQGDAAAAILVGQGRPIATLIGAYSITMDFVSHFRSASADFDYVWENRWIKEEGYMKIAGQGLRDAFVAMGIPGETIDHAAIAIPVRGVPESLAKKTGIRPDALVDTMWGSVGDAGAAHSLLMLSAALENARPGEKILVAAFGQGLDVLVFETTDALTDLAPRRGVRGSLARRKEETNYARFLFHRGLLDLDRGMRAEMDQKQPGSTLFRNRKTVLGLVGGRCTKTGAVQFPKTAISVHANSQAVGTQEDYPLAERHAHIKSYTADALTYSPDPPTLYGIIDFEGGGRIMAEFTDVDPDEIDVGKPMRMIFRIKAVDELRGFKRYFWKATAADDLMENGNG